LPSDEQSILAPDDDQREGHDRPGKEQIPLPVRGPGRTGDEIKIPGFGLLEDLQVYRGYPDGSARPTATIRRDEFCAIVVRMIGQESLAETRASDRPDFSDDIPGWAWGYVNVATSLEIIYGYDDHTFRPANPVTFAEGFAMLTRALELDRVATGAWPGKPAGRISPQMMMTPWRSCAPLSRREGTRRGFPRSG